MIYGFKIKLDVGWVYVGGVDPVEYMEKIKDRIDSLLCSYLNMKETGYVE